MERHISELVKALTETLNKLTEGKAEEMSKKIEQLKLKPENLTKKARELVRKIGTKEVSTKEKIAILSWIVELLNYIEKLPVPTYKKRRLLEEAVGAIRESLLEKVLREKIIQKSAVVEAAETILQRIAHTVETNAIYEICGKDTVNRLVNNFLILIGFISPSLATSKKRVLEDIIERGCRTITQRKILEDIITKVLTDLARTVPEREIRTTLTAILNSDIVKRQLSYTLRRAHVRLSKNYMSYIEQYTKTNNICLLYRLLSETTITLGKTRNTALTAALWLFTATCLILKIVYLHSRTLLERLREEIADEVAHLITPALTKSTYVLRDHILDFIHTLQREHRLLITATTVDRARENLATILNTVRVTLERCNIEKAEEETRQLTELIEKITSILRKTQPETTRKTGRTAKEETVEISLEELLKETRPELAALFGIMKSLINVLEDIRRELHKISKGVESIVPHVPGPAPATSPAAEETTAERILRCHTMIEDTICRTSMAPISQKPEEWIITSPPAVILLASRPLRWDFVMSLIYTYTTTIEREKGTKLCIEINNLATTALETISRYLRETLHIDISTTEGKSRLLMENDKTIEEIAEKYAKHETTAILNILEQENIHITNKTELEKTLEQFFKADALLICERPRKALEILKNLKQKLEKEREHARKPAGLRCATEIITFIIEKIEELI